MASTNGAQYDVIVVGAGISGLYAAHLLKKRKKQLKVLVLEARDRVGGRTLTAPLKVRDGAMEHFDLGGQWVGPQQAHLLKLLEEFEIETYPQFVEGKKVLHIGDEVKVYNSNIPPLNSWLDLIKFQILVWKMESMARRVPIEDPSGFELAPDLDSTTVADFCDRHFWTRTFGVKELLDAAVKTTFGTDVTTMSVLSFLALANSAGGILKMFEVKDAAQQWKIKGGAQQISERLAGSVGRQNILFNAAVVDINQQDNETFVTFRNSKSDAKFESKLTTVRAKKVVFAAPVFQVSRISWNPPLNPLKKFAVENMMRGNLTKFIVTYQENHWRNTGFSGEIVSSGGEPSAGCSSGPISITFDATTDSGAPAIVGFIGGRSAVEWQNEPESVRRDNVVRMLCQYLGPDMKNFITYQEKAWQADPWAGGCPSIFGPPGTLFAVPHLYTPEKNVHFANTDTATVWTGYMSGAAQAGERAALEVIADLNPELLTQEEKRTIENTKN